MSWIVAPPKWETCRAILRGGRRCERKLDGLARTKMGFEVPLCDRHKNDELQVQLWLMKKRVQELHRWRHNTRSLEEHRRNCRIARDTATQELREHFKKCEREKEGACRQAGLDFSGSDNRTRPDDLVTLKTAGAVVGRSPSTIRRWISLGHVRRWEGSISPHGGSPMALVSTAEVLACRGIVSREAQRSRNGSKARRLRAIVEPESGDPLRLLVDRPRLRFDGERWTEVENESTWTDREALVLGTVRIVGEDGSEVEL